MGGKAGANDDMSIGAAFLQSVAGRDDVGGGGAFGGLFELLIGQLSGQNSLMPTQSTGQYEYTKEMADQLRKLVDVTTNQDQRFSSMLRSVGTAAGGARMGDKMSNMWEGLPMFAKQMISTMINQTELGGLLGGDTTALAHGALSMARAGVGLDESSSFSAAMGDIVDPMRHQTSTTITKSVMDYMTDPETGLPILERTQGQSFDTIGKLLDHMQESGAVRTDQLINSVNTKDGTVDFNKGELDKLNKNLTQGAELFRNLTDVFGSRDFNELLDQAKRLGGLNLQDPSSIGRSLTTIRNARGIAQAIGGDERRLLGLVAQQADTFTQVTGTHGDPSLGAVFANESFRGAAMQAAADKQSYRGAANIYNRTATLEERMQNSVTASAMQLESAKQDPHKSYAKIYQLKTFLDKNEVSDDLREEITTALNFEGDADEQMELLSRATYRVYNEHGVDLIRKQRLTGVDFRHVGDDTKASVHQLWNKRTANLNKRRSGGLLNSYMDVSGFDTERTRHQLESEDADNIEEVLGSLQGMREIIQNHDEIGYGLGSVSELMAIAEGNDVAVLVEEDGKFTRRSAQDMTAGERRKAVLKKMQDMEAYHGKVNQDELQQKAVDQIFTYATETRAQAREAGVTLGGAQQIANMRSLVESNPAVMTLSKKAIRDAERAAEEGTLRMEGSQIAATNPLLNAIYGAVGGDMREASARAFDTFAGRNDTKETFLETDRLTTTQQQRQLAAELATADEKQTKEIMSREGVQEQVNLMKAQADYLSTTKVQTQKGEQTLAQVLGVSPEVLESIQSDSPIHEKAGAFEQIVQSLGGSEGRLYTIGNKLREAGLATTQDKAESEAMRKRLYKTLGEDGEEKVEISQARAKTHAAGKSVEKLQEELDTTMKTGGITTSQLDKFEQQTQKVLDLKSRIHGEEGEDLDEAEVQKRREVHSRALKNLKTLDPEGKLSKALELRMERDGIIEKRDKLKTRYADKLKESGASEAQLADLKNMGWSEYSEKYKEDSKVANIRQAIDSQEEILAVSGSDDATVNGHEEVKKIMTYDRRKDVSQARKVAALAEKYGDKKLKGQSEALTDMLDVQSEEFGEQSKTMAKELWNSDTLLTTLSGQTKKDGDGVVRELKEDEINKGIQDLYDMGYSRDEIQANLKAQASEEGITDERKARLEAAQNNVNSFYDEKESQGGGIFGIIRELIEKLSEFLDEIRGGKTSD